MNQRPILRRKIALNSIHEKGGPVMKEQCCQCGAHAVSVQDLVNIECLDPGKA